MISHQFAAISEIGSNLPQFECERWWKAAIVEHIDCPDYQMLSYFPGTNIKDCPGFLFQEKHPHRIGITLTMFVKATQQDFLNRNVFVIMTVIEALHCFYCSNYARFVKTTIISWEKDFDFEVPWKWWACLCSLLCSASLPEVIVWRGPMAMPRWPIDHGSPKGRQCGSIFSRKRPLGSHS